MDSMGSGGSGDEHQALNSRKGKKKSYHRHTAGQTQRLEAVFKDCPHPDENQRRLLSRELRLEPRQIKFWFQNKRTQTKTQNERADNSVLRAENERIQCENLAIMEALKSVICPSCGGPPFGEEERQRSLEKLKMENVRLKEEHEKVANLLAKFIGKPISQIELLAPVPRTSVDVSNISFPKPGTEGCNAEFAVAPTNSESPGQMKGISEKETANTVENTVHAMDELIRLLRINEPLWIRSPLDGRYVLHRESYERIFTHSYRFRGTGARLESSKESVVVNMNASNLVHIFLDANKWADMFHTVVMKASTIQVFADGNNAKRNSFLQLMYAQMHVLSPLVPTRDFYFLRCCQQIEADSWVIVDVSYNYDGEDVAPYNSWRLPSGCMIQNVLNGCSKVTWVEHVEVDDKNQTHKLYRDLVSGGLAYGAERWTGTLQRMCERFTFSIFNRESVRDLAGVILAPEGRKSITKLAHRMVKNFCAILSMSGKLDFPHLSEVNNSGVRVSVRKNVELGQPNGMVVSAATSLWLPLTTQTVFNLFRDDMRRAQWDVLCNGNPVRELAHISTGTHPGNSISVIQSRVQTENMLMLQETSVDPLTSYVVYAPIDPTSINVAMSGEDTSNIQILPSGFTISSDGRPDPGVRASTSTNPTTTCGSLLTVAFQILVSSPGCSKQVNVESIATVNTLISSTVQKIKAALNCSSLE